MECCTAFLHFCRLTGLDRYLRRQTELHFVARDGRVNRFRSVPLPAPLHLLPALGRLSWLSRSQRREIRRGLMALARDRQAAHTQHSFAHWLQSHGQSPETVEHFWNLVLVSALSETPDRIAVRYARKVFLDGFLSNASAWRVHIPTVPLGELYGSRLANWFAEHGISVRLQCRVAELRESDDGGCDVVLVDGEIVRADRVILAVPHHLVSALVPDSLKQHPAVRNLESIETAPISSVHLWFDRPITSLPHAVFVDRMSQWLFNRDLLCDTDRHNRGYYVQVVISASRQLTGESRDDIVQAVLRDLGEVWPATRAATVLHSRVVTEHRAVFSVTPGIDALRPRQTALVEGTTGETFGRAACYLAGDWTATGWPSTMESAVRSGFLAAEAVLASCDRPQRIMPPEHPGSLLFRLLFGRKGQSETPAEPVP